MCWGKTGPPAPEASLSTLFLYEYNKSKGLRASPYFITIRYLNQEIVLFNVGYF